MQIEAHSAHDQETPSQPPKRSGMASSPVIAATVSACFVVLGGTPISPSDFSAPTARSQSLADEKIDTKSTAFESMAYGESILNKTITITLSWGPNAQKNVTFHIERTNTTKSTFITVDGKTYTSDDTIWWLAFAKATDVLSDIQADGQGGMILTADTFGHVIISPDDTRNTLHQLSLAPMAERELSIPVKAFPTAGSVAESILGNRPNEVTCVMRAKYVGLKHEVFAKK